jgi:hypothetical protein
MTASYALPVIEMYRLTAMITGKKPHGRPP